ncbi:MAG: substrate binding domain-containing protein, partial [Sulfitobacter sp.]
DPGKPRGILRITAPDAIGRRLLIPVTDAFLRQWPDVQVEMNFSDRIDNIIDDGFDLAIRLGVSTPPHGLIARTLRTDTLMLCAAPTYFEAKPRPQTAEQLGMHDLLHFTSRGVRQNWKLQEPDGTWVRAQGRSRLRLESGEGLRDAALAGMGIALLPRQMIEADIESGELEQVLTRVNCGEIPIVALYPHRRHL